MALICKATCPECSADIELEDPVIREIVECSECGAELEVSALKDASAKLVVAELEGDDWGE